jgi:hypothetical protein
MSVHTTPPSHASLTVARSGMGARLITTLGLACTFSYLVWRAVFSWHGANLWLSSALLALEIVGFAGSSLLVWALWGGHRLSPGHSRSAGTEGVDVVIRVADQPEHDIVATVLAAKRLQHVSDITVLVLDAARPRAGAGALVERPVRDIAVEHGLRFLLCAEGDVSGVTAAAKHCVTPAMLLLDAGDVPAPDALEALRPHLDDSQVAAVQAGSFTAADETLEHGPNGLHYDTFERATLNPALGRRHTAILAESGVLFRRGAIESLGAMGTLHDEPDWSIALALMNHGWAIDAHSGAPLVAHQGLRDQRSQSDRAARRIRAARHLVFGRDGALRSPALRPAQRLALLAWSVRPLSGMRRLGLIGAMLLTMIGGYEPFDVQPAVLASTWLPGFVLTSLGLAVLSGWALRPGDRARWSLRYLNDTVRSLREPGAPPSTAELALQTGPLVLTVTAITITVVLRAISERLTGAFGPLPAHALRGVLLSAMWTLGVALDSLDLLSRESSKRRALRRSAELAADLRAPDSDNSSPVTIVDLGPLGAGLSSGIAQPIGQRLVLSTTLSSATDPHGRQALPIAVPVVVRNCRRAPDGWRIGVEFDPLAADVAVAVVELTMVEPATARLAARPVSIPNVAPYEVRPAMPRRRRVGLRAAALIAVGAATATATATSGPNPSAGLAAAATACLIAGSVVVVGVRRPKPAYEPSVAVGVT